MTPKILRPQGAGRFVFFCDHASNFIPPELHFLGLPPAERARHIAWDIGAAGVTEALSEIFDSPAILCGISRLVVDANRHPNASDLIPGTSDGTVVPGNLNLSASTREARIQRWFHPYHDAVEAVFLERESGGVEPIAVSIHSMAACLNVPSGRPEETPPATASRPWQIAFSSHRDRRLTDVVLAAMRHSGDVVVGDNQPYDLDPDVDYSIPYHAMRRNLAHLQVEFRQDEISDPTSRRQWALRLARALR